MAPKYAIVKWSQNEEVIGKRRKVECECTAGKSKIEFLDGVAQFFPNDSFPEACEPCSVCGYYRYYFVKTVKERKADERAERLAERKAKAD